MVVATSRDESAEAGMATETPSVTASGIAAASSTSDSGDAFAEPARADDAVRLRSTTLTPNAFLSVKFHSNRHGGLTGQCLCQNDEKVPLLDLLGSGHGQTFHSPTVD